MNATELFHADGKSAGIFYCGQCRIVKRTREEADQCCDHHCQGCDTRDIDRHSLYCSACTRRRDREREEARFAKADKITSWDGPVYLEGAGEDYFVNVADLIDWLESEAHDQPTYVWTCSSHCFCQLDYGRILENATQEAYEDWDPSDVDGADELKAAIEKFNEANTRHVCWQPDYKRALLLPEVHYDNASEGAKI